MVGMRELAGIESLSSLLQRLLRMSRGLRVATMLEMPSLRTRRRRLCEEQVL